MSDKNDNLIDIEVNGEPVKAKPGQMIIEVTDAHDAYVPRFCYHHKLSVAANCRMCLVDVEKAPKPLPACATPVAPGMKVFTRSPRALAAQKATMEFLLINHPLDCPICDQGGECELQDLAVGFGRGVSRYTEKKRVVPDENLGPLVSTDMTRCIQCTRCVRFGQEVAGIQELGTVGRGENMKISTYVEKSVDHELSGNIIDLCPVGALNNKPYRFSARAWEMIERPLVGAHDCAGSNLDAHVLRGRIRRIVPRENESINETWISDRDRFSCFGIYAEDRLEQPMVKVGQEWREVSWQQAMEQAASSIGAAVADEGEVLGMLAHPSSTVEELHLLRRIADKLGSRNIDHRLRRVDFSDQEGDPEWPALGVDIADVESLEGMLFVGTNLRMEVPILAHRVRKAAQAGAAVGFVNPQDYPMLFPVAAFAEADVATFVRDLGGVVLAAASASGGSLPDDVGSALDGVEPTEAQKAAADVLLGKENAWIAIGQIAQRHPRFSEIRRLCALLAEFAGARLGYLSEGSNSAGAALAGCLPHREPGGGASESAGFDAVQMLESPRRAYLLLGIDPLDDLVAGDTAAAALKSADTVVVLTAFASEDLLECADILLPIATFAETDGTFVNGEGRWQTFEAAAHCAGDSRPAWRILRVLGNLLDVPDCDYQSCADVREELQATLGIETAEDDAVTPPPGALEPGAAAPGESSEFDAGPADADLDELDVPIYQTDPVVRRSAPLQQTRVSRERAGELPAIQPRRSA